MNEMTTPLTAQLSKGAFIHEKETLRSLNPAPSALSRFKVTESAESSVEGIFVGPAAAAATAGSSSSKVRTPSQSHPFRVIEPDTRSQASADSRSVQSRSSVVPPGPAGVTTRKYSEAGPKFAEVRVITMFFRQLQGDQ